MREAPILLVTLLVIFCLTPGLILPSFALYTSPPIHNSGIIKVKVVEPTRIRKHVVAYGSLTYEDADFIASNFDMAITGFDQTSTTSRIKSLNPNITILGYQDIMAMHSNYDNWEEVNSHEDWFLHDINGNRLVNKVYGWYAMDVGNAGWRSHYANYVKGKLDGYLAFDGVFADDTWDSFRNHEWTVPPEYIPAEIGIRWHNDMLTMIQTVKTVIGTKLLVLNTVNNKDYVDASDGKMHEHFVHKTSWELDFFGSGYPLDQVNALADVSRRGKIFLAHSGTIIPDNPTEADLDKVHNVMIYCLASYSLGVNGEKATFGFNMINSKDASRGYYSEFDVSLGSPVNEYYSIGSVYARDFADGKVLVNPTTSTYTIDLDSEYKTLDGKTVFNVTLNAHSGIILLRP